MEYLYTSEPGAAWKAFSKALFNNSITSSKSITFIEQAIRNTENGQHKIDLPGNIFLSLSTDNDTEVIDLIDPSTGGIVGTSTYRDIFILLNSLYLKLAKQRDSA